MTDLGYDSLAVPESGDVVTYLEQQCIPRYLIGFERRVEPQLQLLNGRYELKSEIFFPSCSMDAITQK